MRDIKLCMHVRGERGATLYNNVFAVFAGEKAFATFAMREAKEYAS